MMKSAIMYVEIRDLGECNFVSRCVNKLEIHTADPEENKLL